MGKLETIENVRIPVRLGQDAFTTRQFTEETIQMAVGAFLQFRQGAQVFEVVKTRAVATSAVRDASNGDILIDRIAHQTGFSLEVISAGEGARLIHLAVKRTFDIREKYALLIDIDGGSVEVTISDGEDFLSTESYEKGTVRLLRQPEVNGKESVPFLQLVREYAGRAHRRIEQEIVADIVLFHRRHLPSVSDDNFMALSQKDRLVVTELCAILRLADALHTSHTGPCGGCGAGRTERGLGVVAHR
jgi:exopolyphosphatase/pppGpp-phosphohydrolase